MNVYELKLKTLSPVFIGTGSGKDLNKWKYVKNGGVVYAVDDLKLAQELVSSSNVDAFEEAVKSKDDHGGYGGGGLRDFLVAYEMMSKVESLSAYKFNTCFGNFPTSFSIKACVKDGFMVPYIPGTSIKGFIRTAILYDFLSFVKEQYRNEFDALIGDCLNTQKEKNVDDAIISRTLSVLSMENKDALSEHMKTSITDAHWDILRALKISDGYASGRNAYDVLNGYNVSLFGAHRVNLAIEAIKEGIEFSFTFSIDDFIVDELYKKVNALGTGNRKGYAFDYLSGVKNKFTIGGILNMCNNFSANIIARELKYAKKNEYANIIKFYQSLSSKRGALIRLGYGSGLFSLTVNMLLEPNQLEAVREKYFGRKKTIPNNFPKTRRYVVGSAGQPLSPLGWLELEEV